MKQVINQRNFLLLWLGEGISLLGDQFYLVALPWLVLEITGDAVSLGGVLMVAAIPRALLMLIGGAFTDRVSPRNVMLMSNLLRMLIVSALALLIQSSLIRLWMLYLLAFFFGVVDAFFFPAQNSIVPLLMDIEHLQIGNSIIQGTAHLSRFGGPVLAGALIASIGIETRPGIDLLGDTHNASGVALAFGIDAITFLISAITLWMIRMPLHTNRHDGIRKDDRESMWKSINSGFASVWDDAGLRNLFLIIVGINILINGPLLVGVPVLAETRLAEGVLAYGMIMSGFGMGNLLGTLLAGLLPKPSGKYFSSRLLLMIGLLGIGIFLLGLVSTTWTAVIIVLVMGTANGYVTTIFITWLQYRTKQAMLGRVMSLLMFAVIGLNPISMAISGFFLNIFISGTFIAAGVLMSVLVLIALMNDDVKAISFL